MATQPKSILHTQIIFQKDLVWLIGRLSIKTTYYNLYSLHSFHFCLTGDISGRIYVMDDNNICCIINADFVLTNYSTNTNQQSSSAIKLLIDLTTGMEILVHVSSLFIILNSVRNTSWVCWKGLASYYFVTQTRISQKYLQYYYDKELIHFTKKFDVQ